MIVPQFLRFYPGYTADLVLAEYAVRFFSLVNSMYRIRPSETAEHINEIAVGMAQDKDRKEVINQLEKSARGLHGIVQEVRNIKR